MGELCNSKTGDSGKKEKKKKVKQPYLRLYLD